MIRLTNIVNSKILVFIICAILFFLPFFWLSPGELELGGDSNRLFLYDPGSYLQVNSLYSVEPYGMGKVTPTQDLLPFLLFLQFFDFIFHSPHILICLLNSLKLVGAFLFMYLIVVEILKNRAEENKSALVEIAGILAGIFYTFSPSVGMPMQVALLTHNQVFLNPMVFYLMLRFLITQKNKYLWFILLTTFVFSPNFSLIAPPPPFSFYPLAFSFLFLYFSVVLKKSLPWKKLLIGIALFLGIHAFHIIPVALHTFDPGSYYNLRLFDAETIQNEGLQYFDAILPYAMVTKSLFYGYATQWTVFIGPLIVILGFLLSRKIQKDFILIAVFFFITIFLESANITQIGVEFYRKLFYIPGFSMFRNFYGQWQWVQTFFYALLFGYTLFLVLSQLKKKTVYITSIFVAVILIFGSWKFVSGDILRQPHRATDNVSMIIQMDHHYEETLSFLRSRPDDGKIFDFPFTEFSYQVIPGLNSGAYIGPSPTSYLTGRRDFSGHQILEPFSEEFLKLIKEKNYLAIKRLFGLLNVKYILYITDPKAYKDSFPEIPYTLLLKVLPDSAALTDFVRKITSEKVSELDNYLVYNTDKDFYLPHFYIPRTIISYDHNSSSDKNTSFFVDTKEADPRIVYVETDTCTKINFLPDCKGKIRVEDNLPEIIYKRINPTKYKIIVSNANGPFSLVFSDKFHKDWRVFIVNREPEKLEIRESYFGGSIQESYHENIFLDSKTFETFKAKSLPEEQHTIVNGYANAWYITPQDSNGKNHYEIIIEMTQQRIFYFSLGVSVLSLLVFLFYGIKMLKR